MTAPHVSPYVGLLPTQWAAKTRRLLRAYPLTSVEITQSVLAAWDSIFASKIGRQGLRIGKDIFPTPQVMASYFHELLPLEVAALHPLQWRGDQSSAEKDLVYVPDDRFSAEVKTSSDPRKIFANRSYAQAATSFKKNKNGYYIAVNFEKFSSNQSKPQRPRIRRIRFGWLDHSDWKGQAQATGQQAALLPDSENGKLIVLYEAS